MIFPQCFDSWQRIIDVRRTIVTSVVLRYDNLSLVFTVIKMRFYNNYCFLKLFIQTNQTNL